MTLQQLTYAVSIASKGSINRAAKDLFLSQSHLSQAVRDLERELDISIFQRSSRGVSVTREGEEFLSSARQILEQFHQLEERYLLPEQRKRKFSVSTQHYTFAVQAFIRTISAYSGSQFEFAIHETRTQQVIRDVSTMKSELGVLYLNSFNREVLGRLFHDSGVEFVPLFDCPISVYLWREHPLAGESSIRMDQLEPYPCLSFEQGLSDAFYLSEEVMSVYPCRQVIKADDRATMLNLMVGLNGYTLCCGIICEELNGAYYKAVPLQTREQMTIGYLKKTQHTLSRIGTQYVRELKTYSTASTPLARSGEGDMVPRRMSLPKMGSQGA